MSPKTELILRRIQAVIVHVLAICVVLMVLCCLALFLFYINEANALLFGSVMVVVTIASFFMVKTMKQKVTQDLNELKNKQN